MKDAQNPIALRSKEWLANALLELMKNKPFREISISEIAEKADLSRRTFYRSFSSKEEVICFHLQTIWRKGALKLSADEDHSYAFGGAGQGKPIALSFICFTTRIIL